MKPQFATANEDFTPYFNAYAAQKRHGAEVSVGITTEPSKAVNEYKVELSAAQEQNELLAK